MWNLHLGGAIIKLSTSDLTTERTNKQPPLSYAPATPAPSRRRITMANRRIRNAESLNREEERPALRRRVAAVVAAPIVEPQRQAGRFPSEFGLPNLVGGLRNVERLREAMPVFMERFDALHDELWALCKFARTRIQEGILEYIEENRIDVFNDRQLDDAIYAATGSFDWLAYEDKARLYNRMEGEFRFAVGHARKNAPLIPPALKPSAIRAALNKRKRVAARAEENYAEPASDVEADYCAFADDQ